MKTWQIVHINAGYVCFTLKSFPSHATFFFLPNIARRKHNDGLCALAAFLCLSRLCKFYILTIRRIHTSCALMRNSSVSVLFWRFLFLVSKCGPWIRKDCGLWLNIKRSKPVTEACASKYWWLSRSVTKTTIFPWP